MSNRKWHGVPQEFSAVWRQIFNSATPGERARLSGNCPVCGVASLCRYFSLEKAQFRELRGNFYKGPGSYWEWCSSCHSFEHMSGYVPEWWDVEPFDIDHSKLTAVPDLIDQAMCDDGGVKGVWR